MYAPRIVRVFVDFKIACDIVYKNGDLVNNMKQIKAFPKLFSLISIKIMKITVKNLSQYHEVKFSCSKIKQFLVTYTV